MVLLHLQLAFSRGGQFAVLAGPVKDGNEVYSVAVVDVTNSAFLPGSKETVQAFSIDHDLFRCRPGLRPLQVQLLCSCIR